MKREEILSLLKEKRPQLDTFGVKSISLFGSVARNEATPESDIDMLIEFDGKVTFDRFSSALASVDDADVEAERQLQLAEIARRRQLYRRIRPQADVAGRSVILADDGIATGSTMIAALRSLRPLNPRELIVAVPVGSPERVAEIARECDRMLCLLEPENFQAVGQFYREFEQVSDERVLDVLQGVAAESATA